VLHRLSLLGIAVFSCAAPAYGAVGVATAPRPASDERPDVIVVGAGLAGLSAALEAGRGGAAVLVVDIASVFGGHAVMSGGDVTMVATPLQAQKGIHDSAALAYRDFVRWGGDNDRRWVRSYVTRSRTDIYDWLTALGVVFDDIRGYPGASVPRAHQTQGRGLGLVAPVYQACLLTPTVSFRWNEAVTGLRLARGRVVGVLSRNTRTGAESVFASRAVVLATGGFQSNLELVRKHWPPGSDVPERLLAGSGINSMGSGLDLARQAGGAVVNLDHQWNYQRGLPDPRYPGSDRGLNVSIGDAIWVNAQGRRFVNEDESSPVTLSALLKQHPATYWAIFDDRSTSKIWVSGTGWDTQTIERRMVDNPDVLKSAGSIADLARATGLSREDLVATVAAYNRAVDAGNDAEYGRFGGTPDRGNDASRAIPPRIEAPPFHAMQFFPLTRKSMGGIAIDIHARVTDAAKRPIAGLYAAGEAAGLAGINGRAALEGTFLGPSVLTGRVAAHSILRDLRLVRGPADNPASSSVTTPSAARTVDCSECHQLSQLVAKARPGYTHFERAHAIVLEQHLECASCHAEMGPTYDARRHTVDRLVQLQSCQTCHQGRD
jgi:predicted oxidoreductase